MYIQDVEPLYSLWNLSIPIMIGGSVYISGVVEFHICTSTHIPGTNRSVLIKGEDPFQGCTSRRVPL